MSGALKKTTGLTGLAVSRNPHIELRTLYERLLRHVRLLPADYIYRREIEKMVKERTELLQKHESIAAVEEKIGQGPIEEILAQTKREVELVHKLVEYRPWEELTGTAPQHQWTWPPNK